MKHTYNNIMIVDMLNAFIRSYAVDQSLTLDGNNCGGIVGFLNCLKSWVNKLNPDSVILCWDGINGSVRKRALFKEYKQQRKPFISRSNDNEADKNKLWQIETLISILNHLPVCQLYVDNCEADDIIYFVTDKFSDTRKVIVSSDKDMFQLIDDNTFIYSLGKKILVDKKYVKEKEGVSATNHAMLKALMGDSSDNIDGYKGIGPKRAVKLFPFLVEENKHDIIAMKKFIESKRDDRKYERFVNNTFLLERNYDLIKLDYTHLSINQINKITALLDNYEPKLKILELRKSLLKHYININYIDTIINSLRTVSTSGKNNGQ